MKDKKLLFIFALIIGAGIISWSSYLKTYNQEDTVDIHIFPTEINGWTSENLTITDDEYAILETRNAFVRKYTSPKGAEVYLFIVYSESNRKVSHPPEVCYAGNGIRVANNSLKSVDLSDVVTPDDVTEIRAHRLMLEQRNFRQLAYYWFKVGDSFTPSYWKQQGLIAFKSLIGQPASSALIRVSATIEGSEEQADEAIEEFTREITPHLFDYLL